MNLEFTDHCLERMAQRGITRDDVEWALKREHHRSAGDPGSIWISGYAAGTRILRVCVRADDESYVITAAWPGP